MGIKSGLLKRFKARKIRISAREYEMFEARQSAISAAKRADYASGNKSASAVSVHSRRVNAQRANELSKARRIKKRKINEYLSLYSKARKSYLGDITDKYKDIGVILDR